MNAEVASKAVLRRLEFDRRCLAAAEAVESVLADLDLPPLANSLGIAATIVAEGPALFSHRPRTIGRLRRALSHYARCEEQRRRWETRASRVQQAARTMSQGVHHIEPYPWHGQLVFDDPEHGLWREELRTGTDALLDRILGWQAPEQRRRFRLDFSNASFAGAAYRLVHRGAAAGGHWYEVEGDGGRVVVGWLCPAIYAYFPQTPAAIHFRVDHASG